MNSSVRSTSVLRQSASLAGSEDDSSAFLRRCASLCCRAATRVRDAADHLLHRRPGLRLRGALGRGEERRQLALDRLGDQPGDRRGAEHLLGLALELRLGQPDGDDRGHALQHVVLDDLLAGLQQPGALEGVAERLGQRPLEPGDVGAALGGGDDVDERLRRRVVAGAPAHGDVDVELALDVGRGHVAGVVEHRHGLGEPVLALQPDDVGDRLVGGQELAELGDPAVVQELLDRRPRRPRASVTCSARPGTRKLVCRARSYRSSSDSCGVLEEDLPVRPVA